MKSCESCRLFHTTGCPEPADFNPPTFSLCCDYEEEEAAPPVVQHPNRPCACCVPEDAAACLECLALPPLDPPGGGQLPARTPLSDPSPAPGLPSLLYVSADEIDDEPGAGTEGPGRRSPIRGSGGRAPGAPSEYEYHFAEWEFSMMDDRVSRSPSECYPWFYDDPIDQGAFED